MRAGTRSASRSSSRRSTACARCRSPPTHRGRPARRRSSLRDWLRRRSGKAAPERTPTAQLRSALHLVLAGDLSGAEAELAEAARLDSSSSDVYLALANLYRLRGDIGRAIQVHQNLLLRPDIAEELRREALLGLALDFRAGGFLKRAGASFEDLLQLEPENLDALRALERIRIDCGDWE